MDDAASAVAGSIDMSVAPKVCDARGRTALTHVLQRSSRAAVRSHGRWLLGPFVCTDSPSYCEKSAYGINEKAQLLAVQDVDHRSEVTGEGSFIGQRHVG